MKSGLALSSIFLCCSIGPFAADIYVSPNGADSNDGSNANPFRTLGVAQKAVRERIRTSPAEDVTVFIREGDYPLRKPLQFTPEDTSSQATVTYAAYPGETVRIQGGREIIGWTAGEDGIWTAPAPKLENGEDWTFRELYVNGERRQRARHPNDGYFRVAQVGPDKRTSFTFASDDLANYDEPKTIELVFLHDWSSSRIPVESINTTSKAVTLQFPVGPSSRHFAMDNFEQHPRYFLEGHRAFLDAPGEWLLDQESGAIVYKPMPGETLDRSRIIAPVIERLVEVRGQPERPVKNLRFKDLIFEYCAWALPENGYAAGQAGFHERRHGDGGSLREPLPAAITFDLAEDCRLDNCAVQHLGGSAIWFNQQAHRNEVRNCRITDVSGNGVMIGEDRSRAIEGDGWWESAPDQASRGNAIQNSLIEHCGAQFYGSVGVWVGLARETQIARNEIRFLPYTGVSLGWMWNPSPTPARGNRVEFNHIHHVMQILSDGGGIYTLGLQPESVLRGNVIHSVPLNLGRAESNGMFLDEGTTSFVVEDNVIFDIDRSPIRFHRATKNVVKNNRLIVSEGMPPFRYNNTNADDIEKVDNEVIEASAKARKIIEAIAGTAGKSGRQ